jgi:CubicO group peptidase (beta-lactamase class C family)
LKIGTGLSRTAKEGAIVDKIVHFLEECIGKGHFPGAVYKIGTSKKVLAEGFAGKRGDGYGAVNADTIYDIASVTKPLACLGLMKLFEEGKLCLGDRIAKFLPEYSGFEKGAITVFELLTHTSVIPGQIQIYRTCRNKAEILDAIRFYSPRERIKEPVMYSSQGITLIGEIIERLTGASLDKALETRVFEPLGMKNTCFNPGESLFGNIAPTEDCPWRGKVILGQVHDENAVVMGGVCAHAGIFSTAEDLSKVCAAMLTGLDKNNREFLNRKTIELMTANHTEGKNLARGLGWQKKDKTGSPAGDLFTSASYGHTGFTGTSVWIDPELDLYAVLLTNRVHPTRNNEALVDDRKIFHNLAVLNYSGR